MYFPCSPPEGSISPQQSDECRSRHCAPGLVSTNGVETYAALESFDALRVELTTVCRLAQTLELLLKYGRVMLWQNLISRPAIGRRTVCPRLEELHVPLVRVSVELLRTHRRDITDEGVEQDLLHLMTADWGQRSPVQTELPPRRKEEQIWTHICNRSVRWQTHTHTHTHDHIPTHWSRPWRYWLRFYTHIKPSKPDLVTGVSAESMSRTQRH